MIKFYGYVMVNNLDELQKNAVWEDENAIRVTHMGVFHDTNKVAYPQCFKYYSPMDSHCCGDYWPCEKIEMIESIDEEIKRLEDLKKDIDI